MSHSTVGPWAKDKLAKLRAYLREYAKILAKQVEKGRFDGFHYIDAFAGPGEHTIREAGLAEPLQNNFAEFNELSQDEGQQQFIAGSPRVALEVTPAFTTCVFVEKSEERVQELEQLKLQFPQRDIRIRRTDCNKYLRDTVARNSKIDWNRHRAVVFLDPFGMQVPWTTIQELASTRGIEVFINFTEPMAIQRLLLRSGQFTDRQRAKLDDYFGSNEWHSLLYKQNPNMFGDIDTKKISQAGPKLVKWYRSRLKAAFGHVSRAALIRNTHNGPLYYLILASHNRTGVKIADYILSAGESVD